MNDSCIYIKNVSILIYLFLLTPSTAPIWVWIHYHPPGRLQCPGVYRPVDSLCTNKVLMPQYSKALLFFIPTQLQEKAIQNSGQVPEFSAHNHFQSHLSSIKYGHHNTWDKRNYSVFLFIRRKYWETCFSSSILFNGA